MMLLSDHDAASLRLALSEAKRMATRLGDDDLALRLDRCRFAVMTDEQAQREHEMRARMAARR